MDLQEMRRLVQDAVSDADLHPEDIPAIDLYLDQITSLASGKLQEGSPRFYDRVLTKTMVNNYSKDGLLSPINGKKYSKEHFLQMLLVYALKNTLSIGEIKRVLQNVYRLPGYDADMLSATYSRYLDIKETLRGKSWEFVERFYRSADLDIDSEQDFFLFLLGLSAMSSYLKNAVQALLEAHYPDLSAEKEREERARKEEQRRIKEEKKKAATAAKKKPADTSQTEDDRPVAVVRPAPPLSADGRQEASPGAERPAEDAAATGPADSGTDAAP